MARKATSSVRGKGGKAAVSDRRILFVDDEPDVVEPLVEAARAMGFEAEVLEDGKQLDRVLASFLPTHVVVDLVMPEVDGIDVLLALSRLPRVPRIIVVSGYHWGVIESARILAESYSLTDIGWLKKPIDLDQFESLLRDVSTN